MDEIFEECIWHRKENNNNNDDNNNNNNNNNEIMINDRRKCIHVEAETLPYIRTSLPIKRSNCEGLEISK